MNKLEKLEDTSLKILRSVPQIARKPAVLWSTGKDSTLTLFLIRKAFGYFPWPVIHMDTGFKPPEVYAFRDSLTLQWGIPLKVIRNDEARELNISPDTVGSFQCCSILKTQTLKNEVMESAYDALILSIRHDENIARGMEDLLSLRDTDGNWQYASRFGGFGISAPEREGYAHLRVNHILEWTEKDAWEYAFLHDIPLNPLYFAEEGEDGVSRRYRSLGCLPCTDPVESKATTVLEILNEVYMTPGLERVGRVQDKESIMLKLRGLGYM